MESRERAASGTAWPTWPPRTILRGYRLAVSPWLGRNCRFTPSCSRYAEEALERHGLFRGSTLAVCRLLRCHPWHPGGYDPVE